MTTGSGIVTERAVATERFAIAGAIPRFAARPRDREELCELMRAATRDGLVVVPWGGGTALGHEAAPAQLAHHGLAIDLTALDRLVEYEPEDLTLTAECGITLATLKTELARRGQELPLEAAHTARATLGGVLAANASGPRRRRFGSPRDRTLGARFVLGDGTLARTGGKVVKNVAGYGIHRMLCGSRGGLAILVDASLKLLPDPAARAALIYQLDAAALADAARWTGFPREEPAVLTVVSASIAAGSSTSITSEALPGADGRQPFWVAIGFEDDPPRIAELRATAVQRLGEPAFELTGTDVEALWERLADLEDTGAVSGATRLTYSAAHLTPSDLAPLLATPLAGACVFHAACGRLHVFPDASGPTWEALAAGAGFVLIDSRGEGVLSPTPTSGATRALRQRIRAALDPAGRFALGARWERSTG